MQGSAEEPEPFDRRLERARERAGLAATGSGAELPGVRTGRLAGAIPGSQPHPLTFALRLGVEMVAAVAVACAIGYGLDRWWGTRPWLMIAFLPLGVAAGVRNLMRAAGPATGARTAGMQTAGTQAAGAAAPTARDGRSGDED